jgi:hypothetical protein
MKTNQTLTRQMGNFEVFQRTSDGFFNATALLRQWNKGDKKKDLDDFLGNKMTKEYIKVIESKENLNTQKSGDLKVVKSTRGKFGGTWMHPFLFIDFAMWLNVEFKYEVIKFVYDQLIQYRIEAGDTYREMAAEIARISKREDIARNISNVASAINIIVYGRHQREIRNKEAEEQSMRDLVKMQIKVMELIKEGFIKSYDALIDYLRRIWIERNQPKELSVR